MNTLKKVFLLILAALLFNLLLINCTEKDESTGPENNTLVGTWLLTKMSMVFAAFTVDIDPVETGFMIKLTIDADGTYQSVTTDEGVSTTIDGTWSTHDNLLNTVEEGDSSEVEYSLSGDKLTLLFQEEDDGETFTMIQEYGRQ